MDFFGSKTQKFLQIHKFLAQKAAQKLGVCDFDQHSSELMILAVHDYYLEPKVNECEDLLCHLIIVVKKDKGKILPG